VKGKVSKFRLGDKTVHFPTWSIGDVAQAIDRNVQTVRLYEKKGVFDKPTFRSRGKSMFRVYTKGEIDLIVNAFNMWWTEHWEKTANRVPPPKVPRLKEIYTDMKQYMKSSSEYFLELKLPEGYKLPEVEECTQSDIQSDF